MSALSSRIALQRGRISAQRLALTPQRQKNVHTTRFHRTVSVGDKVHTLKAKAYRTDTDSVPKPNNLSETAETFGSRNGIINFEITDYGN
jgi:hypothetical protein